MKTATDQSSSTASSQESVAATSTAGLAKTHPQAPRGIHHVTAIASEPQANVNFYAGLLGLRLVKKTVNFDDPSAYHLYYGDETGTPGSILTWFEFAGAAPRPAGLGLVHTLQLRVPRAAAGDFLPQRLPAQGAHPPRPEDGSL